MMKTDQSQNNDKDSLESFFQKRLESNDLQYNEAQWTKMEAMLDESKPRGFLWFRKTRLFWIWIGLISLLFVNGVLFYWNAQILMQPDQTKNQDQASFSQNPNITPDQKQDQIIDKKLLENPNTVQEKSNNNNQTAPQTPDPTQPLKSESTDLPNNELSNEPLNTDKNNDANPTIPQHIDHKNQQTIADGIEKIPAVFITDTTENKNRQTSQYKIVKQENLDKLSPQPIHLKKLTFTQQLPNNLQSVPVFPVDSDKAKQQNILAHLPFVIGVSYTTDLSTTGLNNFTRPGNKWGINLEYMINPRFSVQAGAQFGKIHYETTGDEYQVPYKFWDNWTNGEVPETVDATCDVIDLSINAKYYWMHKRRSRFFLSGGVSSYFLTREHYEYDFDGPAPNNWDTWEVNNENNNILGIVNLSVGYELAIHPRASIQIEPFLKVPLGEVGFGRVNLFSSGANFHLRYHLGKR